jgi:hypothetical protein
VVKIVHPSKFFKEVKFKTNEFDMGCANDADVRAMLKNIHPLNFINTTIELPVYEVDVTYETEKGQYKNAKKYMILNTLDTDGYDSPDYWAEIYADSELSNRKLYDNRNIINHKINSVRLLAMAVLPIG